MTAPIVQPTLDELNNLPGFPPRANFKLGDHLNSLAASATSVVVFRPGDPNPSVNTYTTWAAAYAAVRLGNGPRQLHIDDDLAPAVVPAGTYDFDVGNIALTASSSSASATLTLDDGAIFTDLSQISGLLFVISLSSAPVMTIVNGQNAIFDIAAGVIMQCNGTAPWFLVQNGGTLQMQIDTNSGVSNGVSRLIQLDAGSTFVVALNGASTSFDDVLTGTGAATIAIDATGATVVAQTVFAGALTTFIGTAATSLGYTPTTPANWVGPAPDTAQKALDRLAAAVRGLLGVPIP